jgi:hypothetical protein
MSSLVFFDDDANNEVLDEWMNNDTGTLVKGSTIEAAAAPASAAKGGLGFAESSQQTKQKKVPDTKAKQLNKAKNNLRYEEDDELHGVVADDVEESRTSFKSKKEKEIEGQKRKIDNQQQKMEQQLSKKARKLQNAANVNTTVPTTAAAESNATGASAQKNAAGIANNNGNCNNKNNNSQNSSNAASKPTTNSSVNTGAASAAGEGANAKAEGERRENSRIRKRTKTRSKQKNIRKDNRADNLKPAHLVVKDKEYKGRPLTQQTKAVLGI